MVVFFTQFSEHEEDDDDDDDDGEEDGDKEDSQKAGLTNDRKYRPPKIAPVHYGKMFIYIYRDLLMM